MGPMAPRTATSNHSQQLGQVSAAPGQMATPLGQTSPLLALAFSGATTLIVPLEPGVAGPHALKHLRHKAT